MLSILTLLSCILLLLTLLPLTCYSQWWIRVWDFPRVQLLAIALLFCIGAIYYCAQHPVWGGSLLIVNLGIALYQGAWIYPYTVMAKKQVQDASIDDPASRLKIMVSNVLTPNRQAHKLLTLIEQEQPDIVVAVETDLWWEQQLSSLEERYPWVIRCPQDNLYGIHVYSRVKVRDPKIQYLVDAEIPSVHLLLVMEQGVEISLHCLHPMPPSPTENDHSADRDAELILVGKSVAERQIPVIVTGDINDVAWSRSTRLFLKISGLMDPRRGRGMFSTFHAQYPLLRWPLDHVFHSQEFVLSELRRLPSIGSDHYPFCVELVYHPAQGLSQEKLRKDPSSDTAADNILANVGAEEQVVHQPGES